MVYSKKCSSDTGTYWDETLQECTPCEKKLPIEAGYEFSLNCGYDDNGGRREPHYLRCPGKTFNNGSFIKCSPCTTCPLDQIKSECNATVDTLCCTGEDACRTTKDTIFTTTNTLELMSTPQNDPLNHVQRLSPTLIAMIASITVIAAVFLMVLICLKTRRKIQDFCLRGVGHTGNKEQTRDAAVSFKEGPFVEHGHYTNHYACDQSIDKKEEPTNHKCTPLQTEAWDQGDPLSLEIQSAPLQMVLEDLDTLEELVILLDPERPGVKNTTHLASRCSFPSTWITYTYSLRTSRSPLKAVLEGVTTRNPNWTVGHLAGLLREIGRNDAVAALAKLSLSKDMV